MSPASPYRIAAERPVGVDAVTPRTTEPPPAPESEAELETVAGEYTPHEPDALPIRGLLAGLAIGGTIVLVATGLILLLTGWSPA